MHKRRYFLLLIALTLFSLMGCGGSSEPEVAIAPQTESTQPVEVAPAEVASVEMAEEKPTESPVPTDAPTPTDVPTEAPVPTDLPPEVTEPAVSETESDVMDAGEAINGTWLDAGDAYPETDLSLIKATGQPQFVNAYTNW